MNITYKKKLPESNTSKKFLCQSQIFSSSSKKLFISTLLSLLFCNTIKSQNFNDNTSTDSTYLIQKNKDQDLTEYELKAYQLIDSILIAERTKKERSVIETFMNGNIPVKWFNLPLKKIIDYNNYEGFRLGLGLMTNDKISKFFSLGGYANYGFKDKKWKYGGDLILNLHQNSESKIQFSYQNDVTEKSGYYFLEKQDLTSSEFYREFLIDKMDIIEKLQVSFSTLTLKYLHLNLFLNQAYFTSTDDYTFGTSFTNSVNEFVFCEIGLQFRYAYNEKYKQDVSSEYSLINDYPIVFGNISRGTNWFDGEYEYTKIEAKITKTFNLKSFGKTKIALVGGLADGIIPISKLYNGHGSKQAFSFEAENSFGTMQMGEFYSDKFFSVFFKHDFGQLFTSKLFSPTFAIVNNYGIASLSNKKYHFDSKEIKSYDKGYYESGFLVNNILNAPYYGIGVGVFYRYGTYSFLKTADNFAYKLSLTIGL